MRRSGTPTIEPIPVRTVPQPWEDLASYISRIAAEIGYRNPGWILHPEEIPSTVQPYNLCTLRRKADYQFLERLLCVDEAAIYGLTLHRFAPRLLDPDVSRPATSEEVQRPQLTRYIFQTFFRPYSATKVCSVCLSEEPVHGRLYWSALPVVACLRHWVFLTDRCPVCQRPIPLLRPLIARCPRCQKGDYREAPNVCMPEDPLFRSGQALILRNLGVQSAMRDIEVADAGVTPLLQLLPWQYFLLLDAFRCILGPLLPDAPFLRVGADVRALLHRRPRPQSELSLLEWSVIIATVHSLCTSWPDNFFPFLEAFPHARSHWRRRRDLQRTTGLHRDFGVFYEKWLYKRLDHPAFAFLHAAFELYLKCHYKGGEVTKRLLPFKNQPEEQLRERPYFTKVQVRAMLGIGEDVLQKLINKGLIQTIKKPIGPVEKRNMFLIEKESVLALQREWGDLIPLYVVAQTCLGVTKAIMVALESTGMLLPKRGPNQDGYKLRLYGALDVDDFKTRLLDRSVGVSSTEPSQVALSQSACVMGIPLVSILADVLIGHLTPLDLGPGQPLLQRLVLQRSEIQRYLFERERAWRENLGLLTVPEASALLGVTDGTILSWIQLGFLQGYRVDGHGKRTSLFIRREVLEGFQRAYMMTAEVAKRLGVVPFTVHKYVRKGILRPVGGRKGDRRGNRLLFLREEVESL